MRYYEVWEKDGASVKIYENGYVDFGDCDELYPTEKAAKEALTKDGFHYIGIDKN